MRALAGSDICFIGCFGQAASIAENSERTDGCKFQTSNFLQTSNNFLLWLYRQWLFTVLCKFQTSNFLLAPNPLLGA